MSNRAPPPWPAHSPRPKGVRAVARKRPDGSTEWHWYDRDSGARLPDPTDPTFTAALTAARRPTPGPNAGSVADAVEAWLRSPELKSKRPRTRDHAERYIDALRKAKDVPLEKLRRATILEWRDIVADTRGHGAANAFIETVQTFLSWCVDRGRIDSSPAYRIRKLERGAFPAWTEAEAKHAMQRFPEAARRAIVLAYHTGQRRGDLVALTWKNIDLEAGRIRLQQEKARGPAAQRPWISLPIPAALKIELRQWKAAPLGNPKQAAMTVLTAPGGRPWNRCSVSAAVQRAVDEAAEHGHLRRGLNLHGLRKLRAASLAEAGATAKEIAAVTGHRTLSMVAHYTDSADQERLATAAIVRLNPRRKRKA